MVPQEQDLPPLLTWLQTVVPDLLELQPASLPLLCSWGEQATRKLELARRKEWPKVGLHFAEALLDTLSFEERAASHQTLLTLSRQRTDPGSPLSSLIVTINSLRDLLTLHTTYRIRVRLAELMEADRQRVVATLLDWCTDPEELPPLVDSFLAPWLQRQGLEVDQCLASYLRSLLASTSYTWHWHLGAAPWEERVRVLLPYLTSVDLKAGVVLEACQAGPVPWSGTMEGLARLGEGLQHEKAVLVKEQASLVAGRQNYILWSPELANNFLP